MLPAVPKSPVRIAVSNDLSCTAPAASQVMTVCAPPDTSKTNHEDALQLIRRFRIPALFCAFAVLLCELISRPFANMGVCDDWTYIRTAQRLAATGHVVYNGVETPILGWQLYLGAAFIKLFGFSLTTVRMSTLLVAVAVAFLLQRILVRAGINERNATIGTLAMVLSPLFLKLSVTFMTDISGLFAIVICLYGCLRALQAATSRATIGWLCFAVAANAICGSSRQIAWLGILVMVPSTLWLLRRRRRAFFAGAAATLIGDLFVLCCLLWFRRQPYSIPEHLFVGRFPIAHSFSELFHAFLDIPFLLLPIVALFLPEIRKGSRRSVLAISIAALGYLLLAFHWRHTHPNSLLEPTLNEWVNVYGIYAGALLRGTPPVLLHTGARVLLTIASIGGLAGLIASLARSARAHADVHASAGVTWKQIAVLLVPFSVVYCLLLIPRSTSSLTERYLLALLVVVLICIVRSYQDRVQPRLPLASLLLVGIVAIYGVAVTHTTFAFYRARVAIAAELSAAGVSETSVDAGWEYNFKVELHHASFINDRRLVLPLHAYVPAPPLPRGTCPMSDPDATPHIKPIYGISFDPNVCYGPAPFAPVHYSRWLASSPGTLYVVNYLPPSGR